MGQAFEASDEIQIYKRVTGTFTQLQVASGLTIVPGDTIKHESNASDLHTTYQNGVSRASVTDTSITGNLQTGFNYYDQAGRIDDFQAADLPPPPVARSQAVIIG
jgi:hypothetical protein